MPTNRFAEKHPAFTLAFSELTNWRLPVVTPDENTVRKSLYFYPLAGLYIGIAAAALPIFFAIYFSALQAFVLFSGCLYVFLCAWLSGFSGFRNVCIFTDVLARKHISNEERCRLLNAGDNAHPGAAGLAACSILAATKVLLVYLLFTRLALFEHTTLLVFTLVTIPFAARITQLFALNSAPAEWESGSTPAGKVRSLPLYLLTAAVFLIGGLILAICYSSGNFITFHDPAKTFRTVMRFFSLRSSNPAVFHLCLMVGLRNIFIFTAGGILAKMYVSGESRTWIGGTTRTGAAACGEIAEITMLAASLLAADYMLL